MHVYASVSGPFVVFVLAALTPKGASSKSVMMLDALNGTPWDMECY